MEQPIEVDPFLKSVSAEELLATQKELLPIEYASAGNVLLFQVIQEPNYLDEFNFHVHPEMFLCFENETILFVGNKHSQGPPSGNVNFTITTWWDIYKCSIYGTTDVAIAKTLAWFWSLQYYTHRSSINLLESLHQLPFDFATLTVHQLASILHGERKFVLGRGTWTAEQSVILATRPYRMHLELTGTFAFEDQGTAFVDAMENRKTLFGVLHFVVEENKRLFSPDNLQRLEKLNPAVLTRVGHCAAEIADHRPFETFDALEHHIETKNVDLADFRALDLSSDSLAVFLYLDETVHWAELLMEFLTGVAEFGYLKRLLFYIDYKNEDNGEPCDYECVAGVMNALIYAIENNPNLAVLDISGAHDRFDWAPHLPKLLAALQKHKSLEYLMVKDYPMGRVHLTTLFHLLIRNRKITVADESHQVRWNCSTLNMDFFMNGFRDHFVGLQIESPALRTTLVGTFLTNYCSNVFQVMPFFMSHHTDVLCDLIENAIVEK